uniref:OSJNBb0076A22.21 protein n=2 Tax=Oryza TaxID=4527 RepID=Q7XV65_ORYSJ|nr:OSJNBb0076A22.21 [Oryza sativa Japonica Group]
MSDQVGIQGKRGWISNWLEREALGTLAGQRHGQPCWLLAHGIFSFIDVLDDAECERLGR